MVSPKAFRYHFRTDALNSWFAASTSGASCPSGPSTGGAFSGVRKGDETRRRGHRRCRTPSPQLRSASTRASAQFARSFVCRGINPRHSSRRRCGAAPEMEMSYSDGSSNPVLCNSISLPSLVRCQWEIWRAEGRGGAATFRTVADNDRLLVRSTKLADRRNQPCALRPVTRSANVSPCWIPPGFERERLRPIVIPGGQATRQQLDGLSQGRLARVVRAHQDGQRSQLHLRPLCVTLVPLDAKFAQFHDAAP